MPTTSVPFPVPDDGVTDAHESLLDAVHEQFEPFMVMPIEPTPTAGPDGLPSPVVSTVALQASGSCVIWNGCPPITSPADRPTRLKFEPTLLHDVPEVEFDSIEST